jgi:hypothetical protein
MTDDLISRWLTATIRCSHRSLAFRHFPVLRPQFATDTTPPGSTYPPHPLASIL